MKFFLEKLDLISHLVIFVSDLMSKKWLDK